MTKITQIVGYGPTRSALGETKVKNMNGQTIKCQTKSAYQLKPTQSTNYL
ncbi:unnamed protein product [Arabidopsis halleri]